MGLRMHDDSKMRQLSNDNETAFKETVTYDDRLIFSWLKD
jgi:hypothetical protein